VFNSNFAPSASQLDTNEVDPVAEADVYIAYGRDAQAEEILKEALRTHPERHAVRLKLLEIYVTRKDARAFETQASELYALTRGQGGEWEQAAAMGKASIRPIRCTPWAPAASALRPRSPGRRGAAAAEPDFGSDFGAPTRQPRQRKPLRPPRWTDLSQDAAPAAAPAAGADNDLDFDAGFDTACRSCDASVSPASVAAENSNLMDFDLDGLSFEPVAPGACGGCRPRRQPTTSAWTSASTCRRRRQRRPSRRPPAIRWTSTWPASIFRKCQPSPSRRKRKRRCWTSTPASTCQPKPSPPHRRQPRRNSTCPASTWTWITGLRRSHATEAPAAAAPASSEPLSAHHMEMDTKLDLAVAYQEIGDKEGARELLDEVLRGGNPEQVGKANTMKAQLG
jgi:pilus assembly protein FimV